ncbi:MAG: Ser/Thr protein kinase RdoA (MazF antagonist) [Oceanicoccus sp.]|jgi:Ser/Thr protein kinase RdoA (MazF antagonist)
MSNSHPYESLTPDRVIDAVESTGVLTDLRIFPLNSYENRVYQVGIEDGEPLIAKFYRSGRWTDQEILEEHQFSKELHEADVPVVPPLLIPSNSEHASENTVGSTLLKYKDCRFSLFQRKGGHAPELDNLDCLLMLGRLVGRIHAVGAQREFSYRPTLDVKSYAEDSFQFVSENFIPKDLHTAYVTLCEDLITGIKEIFASTPVKKIRVHGDCHVGNILWRDTNPHFVDLDDCRMAPAIQDLWMFISGDRQFQTAQINEVIEGYNEFFDFDPRELHLIESMRTLRIMNYSAWLARRWEDPAFPHNFPWFNNARYWSDHILELREQFALLHEPPLQLF